MKKNTIKLTALLLSLAIVPSALTGCGSKAMASTNPKNQRAQTLSTNLITNPLEDIDMNVEPTRLNYVKLAEELERLYKENKNDAPTALAYAEKLVQFGDLSEAAKVLSPLLADKTPQAHAVYLNAQIAYLSGDYEKAEQTYGTLLKNYPDYKTKAEFGLEYVYYQTNQYYKSQALSSKPASDIGEMIRAFGDTQPYQVNWEVTVPFLATDPLPAIRVSVNGELMNFIIDTGTGFSSLSPIYPVD